MTTSAFDILNILNPILAGKFVVKLDDEELSSVWQINKIVMRSAGGGFAEMALLTKWESNGVQLLLDLNDVTEEGSGYFAPGLFATADTARKEAERIDAEDDEEE